MGVILIPPEQQGNVDTFRRLWSEVTEGTFVYRDPTPAERVAQRQRRQKLLEDTRVPWIVDDIGSLMQAYDDVQDVVAFARWNKKLLLGSNLRGCIRKCMATGLRGARDCFVRCACPLGQAGKRVSKDAMRGWGRWAEPVGLFLARLFPGTAPLAYVALAGQVSYSLFGVGIRLGPLFGAGLEYFFRGLESLGLPFGPEHNKYHQLKRARLLQQSDKVFGSARHLDPDDQLTTYVGIRDAFRDIGILPPTVFRPKDLPDLGPVWRDIGQLIGRPDLWSSFHTAPLLNDLYDVGKAAYELGAALPGNILSYLAYDLLAPMLGDVGATADPPQAVPPEAPSPEQSAMLKIQHASACPGGACSGVVEEALDEMEWAEGSDTAGGDPAGFPKLLSPLFGGKFSAGALPGL